MKNFRRIYCVIFVSIFYTCNLYAYKIISVKELGAVGNGLVDDTKAIQNAINLGNIIYFPDGEYLISSELLISSSKTLSGENVVVKANKEITMMRAEGERIILKGISFDGSGKAIHGLIADSNCKKLIVTNCIFHGFYGNKNDQANGIYCASGNRAIKIRDCDFYDIDAPLNGKIGDVYGSCQGILIARVHRCVIENCSFRDVKSIEDGDCIQVFGGQDINGEWLSSPSTIKNCVFTNIYHRAIKLQAADCHINNCSVDADSTRRPTTAYAIFGENSTVKNSVAFLDYGVHAITITGDHCKLSGCRLFVDVDKKYQTELTQLRSDVVYCTGENCIISNNTIKGGYIGFYSPNLKNGLVIKKNVFQESYVRNIRLYDNEACSAIIKNNIFNGNIKTIDFTGGRFLKIINNQMNNSNSYICVLGNSFDGRISHNYTKNGKEVPFVFNND